LDEFPVFPPRTGNRRIVPVLPTIRRFPPVLAPTILEPPVPGLAAFFTLAPVRGQKRFINQAAIGCSKAAVSPPPVIFHPAVLSGPALTGTAAAVIPAYTGLATAHTLAVPGFFHSLAATDLFLSAGCFLLIAHTCPPVRGYTTIIP
jgi:hypothetical protein